MLSRVLCRHPRFWKIASIEGDDRSQGVVPSAGSKGRIPVQEAWEIWKLFAA